MSYTANTAFEARITNNQFEDLCNVTGRFQSSSTDADCSAGFLCVRNGKLPCEGFTGVYNENAWYMNAASSAADAALNDVIYACNTYESQFLADGEGNLYHVGARTLGLGIPAGREGTFTRIDFDNQSVYRFGAGNINGTVGTNTYFIVTSGLLVPAASAPTTAGAVYFALRGSGNFTEGTTASFGYYDLVACRVNG